MAGTNTIRDKAKFLWIKSIKTIGDTATNIANNTKYKVDEMTLQNKRRELSGDLSHVVYSLWMKGTEFPPEVTKMLEELQELDDRLNDIRAEKYMQGKAAVTETDKKNTPSAEKNGETEDTSLEKSVPQEWSLEEPEEDEPISEVITKASPSLQSEINGCFDHGTDVNKAAEKVNSSLDQLTDRIRAFSPEDSDEKENVDRGLSDRIQITSAENLAEKADHAVNMSEEDK